MEGGTPMIMTYLIQQESLEIQSEEWTPRAVSKSDVLTSPYTCLCIGFAGKA